MASSFKRKTAAAFRAGLFENRSRHIDSRPLLNKALDFLPFLIPYIFFAATVLILFLPEWSYLVFLLGLIFVLVAISTQFDYLISAPTFNKANKPFSKTGNAYILIGYDLLFGRQLWIDVDRETRMTIISGTTGSGKTVTLNAQLYQSSIQGHYKHGAPIILFDGKGAVAGVYDFLFYCIRAGRLHDIRILNFLTGGVAQNPWQMLDIEFTSNRFNPFSVLNKEESRGLVMAFGRSTEGGSNEFFRDRASTMLAGVFSPLCYLRDMLGEPLDSSVIQRFIELRNMFKLAMDKSLPLDVVRPLREYLKTLNGVRDSDFQKASVTDIEINSKAEEQHTYNRSMLSKTIAEMTDTLGHIFCSKGSDINLRHAVQHGQIIIVLLPTIEREPDAMAELGRMVVGSLRPALSPMLGFSLQGSKAQTVLSLPSNRIIPLRMYFDEILNYYVKGISNFLSLLRSSKVAMTLLGQSLKGIEDAGISEGRQSMANLNNILAFSTQDVFETMEWITKKLGKTVATRISQMHSTLWGGWLNDDSAQIVEEELVTARDMASADAMEGLYFYRGDAIPFKSATVFQNIKRDGDTDSFYLNWLAELPSPTSQDVSFVESVLGFFDRNDKQVIKPIDNQDNPNEILNDFSKKINQYSAICNRMGSQYSSPIFPIIFSLCSSNAELRDAQFSSAMEALSKKAEAKRALGLGDVDDSHVIDVSKPSIEIIKTEIPEHNTTGSHDVAPKSIDDTTSNNADYVTKADSPQVVNKSTEIGSEQAQAFDEVHYSPDNILEKTNLSLGIKGVDNILQVFVDDDEDEFVIDAPVPEAPIPQDGWAMAANYVDEEDVRDDYSDYLEYSNQFNEAQPSQKSDPTPSNSQEVNLSHLLKSGSDLNALLKGSPKDSDSAATSDSKEGVDAESEKDTTENANNSRDSTNPIDDVTSSNIDAMLSLGEKVTGYAFEEVKEIILSTSEYPDKRPHLDVLSEDEQAQLVERVNKNVDEATQSINDLLNDMFN
ncbi:type IV secretory system conjugative DNA transfer family protein [Vibrio anguillarum]|uniref:type IV secretory system conjugative DNA transfer family protein n=1 Tax=Vibrio anguillarum TaxID=55601 RepID=UPI0030132BCE